jgi:hypothetical protein
LDNGTISAIAALERLFDLHVQLERTFVVVTETGIRFGSSPLTETLSQQEDPGALG